MERIPKVIHYCWFGRDQIPPVIQWCINGWKKIMPDYEYKLWNEENFDVNSTEWTRTAYEAKKYAFVADYVRLYALYTEGGIALDADMKVLKPFDKFLKYDFVSGTELYPTMALAHRGEINPQTLMPYDDKATFRRLGLGITGGVMMCIPQHPLVGECLTYYNQSRFAIEKMYEYVMNDIVTRNAETFGYRFTASKQFLQKYGMMIFEPDVFVLNSLFLNAKSHAIHLGLGSWKVKSAVANKKSFFALYYFLNYTLKTKLRKIKDLLRPKKELEEVYGLSLYSEEKQCL